MVFEKFPVVGGWWAFLLLYMVSQKKVLLRNIVQFQEFEQSNYQYFEVILISGECGLAKPDPAIFQSSLELLDHDRKESVLMIGDSLSSDIAGANKVGIDSCWFNPNRLKLQSSNAPTFTVYSLEEIAPFF